MADLLGVNQSEASKLDRCSELDTGPLRKIIEAMGGEFLLVARFPGGVEAPIKLTGVEGYTRLSSERFCAAEHGARTRPALGQERLSPRPYGNRK